MDFTGKTVLVTGSSRHTGMGIARALLRAGARVGINSPSRENVDRAIRELKAEGLGNTVDATADIADEAQVVGDVITLDGGVDAQLCPKDCEI